MFIINSLTQIAMNGGILQVCDKRIERPAESHVSQSLSLLKRQILGYNYDVHPGSQVATNNILAILSPSCDHHLQINNM